MIAILSLVIATGFPPAREWGQVMTAQSKPNNVTMLPEEIYQAHEVREIDRVVIEQHGVPGIVLMRRAGEAAFKQIMARHSRIRHLVGYSGFLRCLGGR